MVSHSGLVNLHCRRFTAQVQGTPNCPLLAFTGASQKEVPETCLAQERCLRHGQASQHYRTWHCRRTIYMVRQCKNLMHQRLGATANSCDSSVTSDTITGTLPPIWSTMTCLDYLDFSQNNLAGENCSLAEACVDDDPFVLSNVEGACMTSTQW